MTASTGSSGTEQRGVLVRPDHLSVWLEGAQPHGGSPVSDDGRLVEGFTITDWVEDIRLGYPAAVLAATFRGAATRAGDAAAGRARGDDGDGGATAPGSDLPAEWEEWVRGAARLVERTTADLDDATAFRGDTTPTSLRSLRTWVAARLEGHPGVCDDAVLVVSELATNVERHAPSWLAVDLVELDEVVLVAVTDPVVDQIPQPRTVSVEQTSGRGLLVVSQLSRAWGVVIRPRSKTVWCTLPLDPPDPPDQPDPPDPPER